VGNKEVANIPKTRRREGRESNLKEDRSLPKKEVPRRYPLKREPGKSPKTGWSTGNWEEKKKEDDSRLQGMVGVEREERSLEGSSVK